MLKKPLLIAVVSGAALLAQIHAQAKTLVPMTTYRSAADEMTLEYPAVWKRVDGAEAYCQPVVFSQGPGSSGIPVTFGAEFTGTGNFYENTGLEALVFLFGTKKNISVDACERLTTTFAEATKQPRWATESSLQFDYGRGGECGLNHAQDAQVWTRFSGDRCYVFEADFDHYGGAPPGKRDLTATESAALRKHLDGIMRSVRIQSTMLPKSWATTTYRDAVTGVSFEYPKVFRKTNDLENASLTLAQLKGAVFHAKLLYTPPPVPYAGEASTDLSEIAFLYATKPEKSAAACYQDVDSDAVDHTERRDIQIHGVEFRMAEASETGASHFLDAKTYATFHQGTCYLFEEDTKGLDGYAGDVTDGQWKEIDHHLDAIMQSVTLVTAKNR